MRSKKEKIGVVLILVISAIAMALVAMHAPIPQDPAYHLFYDQRMFFGIPNFFNVTTDIPFLFIGVMGLQWLAKANAEQYLQEIRFSYANLFIGISLIAQGSGYYHLWPSNETLVWDRLAMTVAYMALFSIIIGEFISSHYGKQLLFILLVLGFLSVSYWAYMESLNQGDLGLYALVQYLPMLLIPIILLLFTRSFTSTWGYWLLTAAYFLAKILEKYDGEVFQVVPLLSGHSLKHLTAAFGLFLLLKSYMNRELA